MKFFGLTLGLVALVSADLSEITADPLDECLQKIVNLNMTNAKKLMDVKLFFFNAETNVDRKLINHVGRHVL
jgi:hypothetical protein